MIEFRSQLLAVVAAAFAIQLVAAQSSDGQALCAIATSNPSFTTISTSTYTEISVQFEMHMTSMFFFLFLSLILRRCVRPTMASDRKCRLHILWHGHAGVVHVAGRVV